MKRYLDVLGVGRLVVVLAALGVMATAANAQARFVGQFTLPCETHWAGKVLPEGQYRMTLPPLAQTPYFRVDSVRGNTHVYIPAGGPQEKSGERNVIVMTQTGNRCVVRAMNLADINEEFIYPGKRGQQMASRQASQQAHTVIVALGKR
jgi:hypothetical protein